MTGRWFINPNGQEEHTSWPIINHGKDGYWIHHTLAISERQLREILAVIDERKKATNGR
jgi:hypothetical protein